MMDDMDAEVPEVAEIIQDPPPQPMTTRQLREARRVLKQASYFIGICHRCGDEKKVRQEKQVDHVSCDDCRRVRPRKPILEQFRLQRGSPSSVDQERVEQIVALYKSGESYDQIGQRVDLTRERIRQIIVKQVGREGLKSLKHEHNSTILADRAEKKRQEYLALPIRQCAVCWKPTRRALRPRAKRVTCSKLCADTWKVCRHRIDAGQHREHVARWAIDHPDQSTQYQVSWAKRFMAGQSKQGKQHPQPDSKATQAMLWIQEQRAENQRFWLEDGSLVAGTEIGSI